MKIMITIMEGRLKSIEDSVQIFKNTGKLLLQTDGANNIIPVDGMNFGLFYLSSLIDNLFNISPALFINFIFSSLIIVSVLIIFYLLNLIFDNKKILITVFSFNLLVLFYILKKIYLLNVEYILYFLPPVITVLFVECIKIKKIKYNNFILYFLITFFLIIELALLFIYLFLYFLKKKKKL